MAWVQTQHGATIKRLHSDRGGEFTGNKFTKFLQEQGTKRRLTTHDTPQHNGVAEALNRRLMERVHARWQKVLKKLKLNKIVQTHSQPGLSTVACSTSTAYENKAVNLLSSLLWWILGVNNSLQAANRLLGLAGTLVWSITRTHR